MYVGKFNAIGCLTWRVHKTRYKTQNSKIKTQNSEKMTSHSLNLYEKLKANCQNLQQLDQYIEQNGIDVNHESVSRRRSDLTTELFVQDCLNYLSVSAKCNSLDDYRYLEETGQINRNDPAVHARLVDLKVRIKLQ